MGRQRFWNDLLKLGRGSEEELLPDWVQCGQAFTPAKKAESQTIGFKGS